MRILGVVLGIVVVIAAAVVVGGFLLPSEQFVSRSVVVEADQAEVFALVNDYRQFNRWSPWAAKDPDTKYEFSGPDSGVGAKMSWQSEDPNVGSGSQEIIEVEPGSRVRTRLTFEGFDSASYASFKLEPADTGTRVTWEFEANLDSLIGRYMGLMMDKWVGADYEQGLARLKEIAEADGVSPPKSRDRISSAAP